MCNSTTLNIVVSYSLLCHSGDFSNNTSDLQVLSSQLIFSSINAKNGNKVWYILHPNISAMKYCHS